MNYSGKIRWLLLIVGVAIFPLAVSLGQARPSCIAISVTIPKGGSVSTWARDDIVDVNVEVGRPLERKNGRMYNEYLDRDYWGGVGYDWKRMYAPGQVPPGKFGFTLVGRRGGRIMKTIESVLRQDLSRGLDFHSAVLTPPEVIWGGEGLIPDLSPESFDVDGSPLAVSFPLPCLRLASARYLYGEQGFSRTALDPAQDWYEGSIDPKNDPPDLVAEDGDEWQFDCRNALCINQATLVFDWEDAEIVVGRNAAGEVLTEAGSPSVPFGGGVYANFHYVVVPCKEEYRQLHQQFINGLGQDANPVNASSLMLESTNPDYINASPEEFQAYRAMQILLHIAQRSLNDLGEAERNGLLPARWAHGMLPGPFQSKILGRRGDNYDQCEWLDTKFQAPEQVMNYRNFCIWDWDMDPQPFNDQCAMILIYEGDGFSTAFSRAMGYIGPTDIADDFVGLFEVYRRDTVNGDEVTVTNYSGQATLKLATLDEAVCRRR